MSRSLRRGRLVPGFASLALLGALTVVLVACSGGGGGAGDGYVSGDGTVTSYAVGHRKAAPDVNGTTLDGQQLALSSYRGKIVVLNFWGSWCPPCRAEGPFLQLMATDYAPKGVQFVGLDLRDDKDSANAFLQNIGSTYPNLFDGSDSSLALLFNGIVPADAIPSTLIIDRHGRIAARFVGPTTRPRLAAVLDPLVAASL
ncbi:MAG TPA: TlpA disulfide reductase family protein [Actinomycetes bacterium]